VAVPKSLRGLQKHQMDKIVKLNRLSKKRSGPGSAKSVQRPPREAAEEAVRTLIRWSGDDPDREGLVGTPARVVRAYEEWFAGYFEDPREYLNRTFEEVGGYDEIVLLRDIRFESHLHTTWRRSSDAFTLAIFPGIESSEFRSLHVSSMSTRNVFKFKKK